MTHLSHLGRLWCQYQRGKMEEESVGEDADLFGAY